MTKELIESYLGKDHTEYHHSETFEKDLNRSHYGFRFGDIFVAITDFYHSKPDDPRLIASVAKEGEKFMVDVAMNNEKIFLKTVKDLLNERQQMDLFLAAAEGKNQDKDI